MLFKREGGSTDRQQYAGGANQTSNFLYYSAIPAPVARADVWRGCFVNDVSGL
jgi:hypothetical protein